MLELAIVSFMNKEGGAAPVMDFLKAPRLSVYQFAFNPACNDIWHVPFSESSNTSLMHDFDFLCLDLFIRVKNS